MSNPVHTRLDDRPWHQQFWPWFLIMLPASVVVAALATMVIAFRGADDLVATQYYKDGLAINRRLEREEQAVALGISATIGIGAGVADVTLSHPQPPATLQLKLSHPLEADQDIAVILRLGPDSRYQGEVPEAVGERWHWALQPQSDAQWQLSGVITRDELTRHPHH
jgi:hypothetical protein